MAELEDRLNAVLNDPQMMQKIMAMAQSLGAQSAPAAAQSAPPPKPESAPAAALPFDPDILRKLSGFARQNGVDPQQRALLSALSPYLSRDRIARLERAMRAAKMARFASGALAQSGAALSPGR